jgi:xylose isomerase
MDAFAHGLKIAAAIRADGTLDKLRAERYRSWSTGVGAEIESGQADFKSLEKYMLAKGEVTPNQSGRQELFENLINMYL